MAMYWVFLVLFVGIGAAFVKVRRGRKAGSQTR